MRLRLSPFVLQLVLTATLSTGAAYAQPDPAAAQIQSLDDALLAAMKAGTTLTTAQRYRELAPVVERTFDLPVMTAFAVGPAWANFSSQEQQAAVAAFTRLTVASYAHNFKSFDGEHFEIQPEVAARGSDKIVQTRLISPHSAPVNLMYRMRDASGTWKIIDVYYGAISQLTTRRSDFAAPVASGGATGLIAHLNSLSDDLLK